ncbi:MAG: tRNA (N(6)-L-threonylcarbamoyladenosine(37)-C(2))-methylthiotransferase MtaB [Bacteroidales bacterium]|jgi:threonylcarbamoyladenosine tRNA methylthiotransferase MtaB|nr:tRNA (N(6)-L-threonylcarbamoyladenosine(37)-C(2))-methylthiotransferase MtaB [Bacteroidales bacterium]
MIDVSIFEHKKAAYYTLGCKLNFAETSTIGNLLEANGIRKVRRGEIADICVVNTCSVTDLADKKSRQAIRRIRLEHPDAFLVVTGCYAQLKPGEVAEIAGVDLVLGAGQKHEILLHLERLNEKGGKHISVAPVQDIRGFSPSCSQGDRTRYFLKVQDGCDYFCSYCTIPLARGRSRNGRIDAIVQQAENCVRQGGKEIVITGVNVGDFGKTTGETFLELLQALDKVAGVERYRISSVEPNLLTDEIIDFVAASERFAPHFHLPLQSGSDSVLLMMKRKYDTSLFRRKVQKIKDIMPDAFIGVDVIVGTRGETETFFEQSLAFIQELDISQLHVFTYSERANTQALKIDHTVTPAEKKKRSCLMLDLSEKKRIDFYTSQIGTQRKVIFEQPKSGKIMYGFTENYILTECSCDRTLINQPTTIVLGNFNDDKSALKVEIL